MIRALITSTGFWGGLCMYMYAVMTEVGTGMRH